MLKETLNAVINKINPNKTPGRNIFIGFWYKILEWPRKHLLIKKNLFIYLFNYLFIYLSQCEQTGRHIHICSHIDQKKAQGNVSIPLQWVFWCSLYKSYILQIYFTKPTRTLQRDPFINFPFKSTLSLR